MIRPGLRREILRRQGLSNRRWLISIGMVLLLRATIGSAQPDHRPSLVANTRDFSLVAAPGNTVPQVRAMREDFDSVFAYVGDRVGIPAAELKAAIVGPRSAALRLPETLTDGLTGPLGSRIGVSLIRPVPGDCPIRGTAAWRPGFIGPSIEIIADASTPPEQILGVFAHELGHLFGHLGIDGAVSVAGLFDQGFASWAAGRYWTDWQGAPSFAAAVQRMIESGTYIPLRETDRQVDSLLSSPDDGTSEPDCLARRDAIYTEWAGFIDYLVAAHGRDRLFALMRAAGAEEASGSADYEAAYGHSLNALESAWLETLQELTP